jgi:hypothetical protein
MNIQRVTKITILVTAFVWAGYSITSNAQALGASDLSSLKTPINATSASSTQNVEEYADLPSGVARSVQSVVAVQRIISNAPTNNAVVASGVILNDHQVLTAGHTEETDDGALSCVNTTVNAPGYVTAAAASSNPVTYASALHNASADLAVMTIKADQNYRNLPAMTLASQQPKVGDIVYFINYQPQDDGTIRDPLSHTSGDPVIFSGTVIGHDNQGLQIAAGGGTSYGHGKSETLLRKGASGGAIVNSDGALVGLSVSSDSLEANRTPQYIGTNFGISMPEGKYQIVSAQTLDTHLLTKLQSNMTVCK